MQFVSNSRNKKMNMMMNMIKSAMMNKIDEHDVDASGCKACAAVMHHLSASICITHVFPCGFQNVNLPKSKSEPFRAQKI